MSSEEPEATVPAPDAGADGEGKKNNKERYKRDETPIEDLYDLSQPIPRVDKPNKTEHDAAVQEITDAIDAAKEDRRKIQAQIDNAMNDPESKSALQTLRGEFNELKTQKTALINEKKAMRAQLDQAKSQTDKLIKEKKDARSNVRFTSVEEINKEIAKLQKRQETTTMTLNEEKRLIKEMDALEASKRFVADVKSKDVGLDNAKEQRKTIGQQISAKDKEIDALSPKMDEIMVKIKAINAKDSTKRDSLQSLFTKREEYKKIIGEKLKERDAIRDAFREKNNVWFNYQRAVRAQKKMAYEEEKKQRDEEHQAYLAKIEEEEAKKVPYEEEQALCDYLADYLERTYLSKSDADADAKKTDDVVAVKDDPFAGFKPVSKKDDGEEEYFGKGKGKKTRKRTAKKQDSAAAPFTLSVDSFEQFGLLSLNPPTSVEQVANSVKELREKKEWYKQQPRGSVPTAAEIRKANEKAAAKIRQQANNGNAGAAAPKKGSFSLSNDDFTPLGGGGTASTMNSTWGQKPAAGVP